MSVPKAIDDPLVRAIGQVIRERRLALRLPQEAVGGVSRVWLQRIEIGSANPSVQSLALIAEALETTASALLAEAERRAAGAESAERPETGDTLPRSDFS